METLLFMNVIREVMCFIYLYIRTIICKTVAYKLKVKLLPRTIPCSVDNCCLHCHMY